MRPVGGDTEGWVGNEIKLFSCYGIGNEFVSLLICCCYCLLVAQMVECDEIA
jgi:hypothetical protein